MMFRPILVLLGLALALAAPAQAADSCAIGPLTIPNGGRMTLYSAPSVPRGGSCAGLAATRICQNGDLSRDDLYRYGSCTVLEGFTGVNTNLRPGQLDPRLVEMTGARWFRSTVDVLKFKQQFETGRQGPNLNFSEWTAFNDAVSRDRMKAILNLKWDFAAEGTRPPLPDSPEEKALFAYLDGQILDQLAPSATVIVAGNEPFINTPKADWAFDAAYGGIPIVVFYQRVTEHVNQYLIDHGLRERVQLYLGAFTQLYGPVMQRQPAVRQLLAYADAAPFVDGIDLHTHVQTLDQIDSALAYARAATAKPIIITEYTYVWAMQQAIKGGDRLGARFAGRWGYRADMLTLDYLKCDVFRRSDACASDPRISKEEWDDFLATRPWFISHFLLEADRIFRRYDVRGATYGLMQIEPSVLDLTPEGTPWYLGFLFSPAALGTDAAGVALPNYQALEDFQSLRH